MVDWWVDCVVNCQISQLNCQEIVRELPVKSGKSGELPGKMPENCQVNCQVDCQVRIVNYE